jgi:uncharacterized membrane protein YfcA
VQTLSALLNQSVAGFEATLFVVSLGAGVLGAILGLGGGIVIVPVLTLMMGINIRYAIGASIVSVIATSSGAAASYVRDHITNIRVAILLEVATTAGALTGGVLAARVHSGFLFALFAGMLLLSAGMMVAKRRGSDILPPEKSSPLAKALRLDSEYADGERGEIVRYGVTRVPLGFFCMAGAGIVSGLLGIGSGALKVPAMDTAMNLPIKASSATSNFMIGVTAAASAGLYFMKGAIVPALAAPVALGVLGGSFLGSLWMPKMKSARLRAVFVLVLVIMALQMLFRGPAGAHGG